MALLAGFFFCSASAVSAQLQQSFVYTTGGGIATRNDQTGVITATADSPLGLLGFPVVLDAKGRFLFAAGNDSIHMYEVSATTGAYTEVAGSPFASANTNGPMLLATEPTGAYLAVVNATGLNAGESSVETFHIDPEGETLVPVAGSFLELVSSPVGAASNPAQGKFFVYLGPNPSSLDPAYQQDGDLLVYTVDPDTGLLGDETGMGGTTDRGRAFGAEALGRFVVSGFGQKSGTLEVTSAAGQQGVATLGAGVFPQEIFVGPGQRFVYVTVFAGQNSVVRIFIVDPDTWTLTEAPSSPLPGFSSIGGLVADPTGPFVYQSIAPNQLRVYSVDIATGYLTEIAQSPFTASGFGLPVAFSVDPDAVQPEVGAVATLTPPSLSFGSVNIGSASTSQTVMLTSTGDQALAVNHIQITGANTGDFAEIDTCGSLPMLMQPTQSCAIFVTFLPTASGARAAELTVSDDGAGSPQSVGLSGTGTGQTSEPAISFAPSPVIFPAIAQGSSSAPVTITVTNSGGAALNISNIILGGNNATDFSSPTTNCIGAAIAANGTCTVTETFAPQAIGSHSATLTFIDNAAGSPHSLSLQGTATGNPSSAPAAKITPTLVNFPSTTQGLASVAIDVKMSNIGNAPMHISGITASGANAEDFANTFAACANATIAANSSCTVSVAFTPLSTGARNETLLFADDAAGSPQSINISANAAPAFTLTSPAASLSATVSAGQTATYNLQLTPGLDFNGTVAFTCSGAPLAATCKVPATVVINTNAVASFSVMVSTSGNAAAFSGPAGRKWRPRMAPFPIAIFVIVLGAYVLLRQFRVSGAERLRIASWSASVLALAAIVFGVYGCTGNVQSAPAPQGNFVVTPSGTSILVLTPSAMNAAGKALQLSPIQLTLIVK